MKGSLKITELGEKNACICHFDSFNQVNYFMTKMQPARRVLFCSNVARGPKRVAHPWIKITLLSSSNLLKISPVERKLALNVEEV